MKRRQLIKNHNVSAYKIILTHVYRHPLIAKPVETDFEQSLLTIFDCRKVTNCA